MHHKVPLGKLIIIGGHEDKGEVASENLMVHKKQNSSSHFEILGSLISKIPRAHHVIEIIAAASSFPEEMETMYINSYKQVGFTHVGILKIKSTDDASDKNNIQRIKVAHAVFFTGGDQIKLVAILANTDLLKAIKNKYYADKNFMVGGTSAGAMAIPENIITGGLIHEALYNKDLTTGKGLNLIQNILVDTHFIKRGRFARLAHAVALHPTCLGVGLGEDTALIISEGTNAQCIGSGMVVIIDGEKMGLTNIKTVDDSTPIIIENLIVTIIAEGSNYSLMDRRIIGED